MKPLNPLNSRTKFGENPLLVTIITKEKEINTFVSRNWKKSVLASMSGRHCSRSAVLL